MIEAIDPRVDMHIVDVQTLILAVSPTPVLNKYLFTNVIKWRLYALQQVHEESLVGVKGYNLMKIFAPFLPGEQINSLKLKKTSKLIYFKCKFNTNLL